MTSVLERSGRVRSDYAHRTKIARPGSLLFLEDAVLKWYEIAPADEPVPLRVRELAYHALCRGTMSGELELSGELGFVILHRCDASFYFLLVSTWRNDNELWETALFAVGLHETLDVPPRPAAAVGLGMGALYVAVVSPVIR